MSLPHTVMQPAAKALERPITLRWLDLSRAGQTQQGQNQANQHQVRISEHDRALAYGDGLFATLKVRDDGQVA
ncbi:MAG: hypothetical protein ACRC7Q_03075, partial [Plesiomonas shigelloides]